MPSKIPQDRTKTAPRAFWRATFSLLKIVSIFASCWVPFWSILAPKMGQKQICSNIFLGILGGSQTLFILGCFGSPPREPKRRLRGPRKPPGAPQEAPRALQERSRRLQEGLKRLQEPVKRAQDFPRSPQEAPKDTEATSSGAILDGFGQSRELPGVVWESLSLIHI